MIFKALNDSAGPFFYFLFRFVIGVFIFMHGLGKLVAGAQGLMFWAGLFEVLIGIGLALGLLTRLAGLFSAILFIVAYFMMHAKDMMLWAEGIRPQFMNGELAIIFFVISLFFMAHGAGAWSLERMLFKKEIF